MAGHLILLNLLGGIALLLWGTRMTQGAVTRGFGPWVRATLGRVSESTPRAAVTGAATAAILQSSTATAVLLLGFVERGIIALPAALAVILGADFGTTLVVQALAFDLRPLVPILLIAGVVLSKLTSGPRGEEIARLLMGFALMLLALGLILHASDPLRESPLMLEMLGTLGADPILAILVSTLLAWLMHSSVAFVLFTLSLAGTGLIGADLALTLVLGANLGACLVPMGLALRSGPAARRVLWGNLAFRAAGVVVALPLLGPLGELMARLTDDPARQVANFHALFNLAVSLVWLPFVHPAARILTRLIPEPKAQRGAEAPRLEHLDGALLNHPPLALNAATRELMRLADMVELMLREAILTFEDRDDHRVREVARVENDVDALQEEIKFYLARLMQSDLDAAQSARLLELVLFTTNLEHIGDIIDKNILKLATKKQRKALTFSPEGWNDIRAFHGVIADQMRLALTVFVTREMRMARDLVARKDQLRAAERTATERHFARLRDGRAETIETSALHLDLLRDLKRINAHLTTVAYPILEPAGALNASRLRSEEAPAPRPVLDGLRVGSRPGAAIPEAG